jgi:prepilin-type N-terminal cleavage/methylation domain-containing protein/prepilin-type processing-associated H-X9-DG protein
VAISSEFDSERGSVESSRGFTLIELLVVITVIAVLAGLLLPALSRAKEEGRTAVCRGNLQQLGIALSLYIGDFAAYPTDSPFSVRWGTGISYGPGQIDHDSEQYAGIHWWYRMIPYVRDRLWWDFWNEPNGPLQIPQYRDAGRGIYSCPSLAHAQGAWSHKVNSYGYNWIGLTQNWWQKPPLGLGGHYPTNAPYDPYRATGESEVLFPSEMVAIGDSDVWAASSPCFVNCSEMNPASLAPSILAGTAQKSAPPATSGQVQAWEAGIKRRHNGRWQIVFCDGHVDGLKTGQLYDFRQVEVRQRWNKDHEPHPEIKLPP